MSGVSMNEPDAGKLHDLLVLALDLPFLHPQHGPVEVDVLAPGQLRVEAGAHLQQRPHPPAYQGAALGRLGDAGKDLQQRGLAGAVAPDDADRLAAPDVERNVLERPDVLPVFSLGSALAGTPERRRKDVDDALAQRLVAHELADAVAFAQALDLYGVVAHLGQLTSAKPFSLRRK